MGLFSRLVNDGRLLSFVGGRFALFFSFLKNDADMIDDG
jgi:hypothetical protein